MPNTELLNQVMTLIKDNPERHDQGAYLDQDQDGLDPTDPSCGTAQCFAGWALHLTATPEHVRELAYNYWNGHGNEFHPSGGPEGDIAIEAATALGITIQDARILFDASNSVDKLELMVKDLANDGRVRSRFDYED